MAANVASELGEDSPIGILSWNGHGLRCYKPAKYLEISADLACQLLYNALKKWCDGVQRLDK